MKKPSGFIHSQRTINSENQQYEKGWTESLPLQQKSHNINHAMNSTVYKSLSKKNELNKKKFNYKFFKMQQGEAMGKTCLSFFKRQLTIGDKQNYQNETSKGSNFRILKKQIEYLQQNDFDNEKFPNHTASLSKNGSLCFSSHLKNNDTNLYCKPKILTGKPLYGNFLATCKNLAMLRQRPGTSQNKEAKKYFSNSKKKSARKNDLVVNQCEQAIHTKNHNRFELIAPFRKYFQSKRHRQNRSCTIKIEQLCGKKLNKLAHFTLESTLQ